MEAFAADYAYGPTRVQFENKDPRGFAEFKRMLAEHSAKGAPTPSSACSASGRRSTTWWTDEGADVPTLVVTGDEDWPCLLPGVLMKRTCPAPRCRWCRTAATPSTSRSPTTSTASSAVPRPGRRRPLAHARPPCGGGVDHRDAVERASLSRHSRAKRNLSSLSCRVYWMPASAGHDGWRCEPVRRASKSQRQPARRQHFHRCWNYRDFRNGMDM